MRTAAPLAQALAREAGVAQVQSALSRLTWLFGLSEQERDFVLDLAKDATDFVTASVYADWLAENGRNAESERVRLLSPKDGDVLVGWAAGAGDGSVKRLASEIGKIAEALRERGTHLAGGVALPPGAELAALSPEQMRKHGWVSVIEADARVRHEREACARLCDGRAEHSLAERDYSAEYEATFLALRIRARHEEARPSA